MRFRTFVVPLLAAFLLLVAPTLTRGQGGQRLGLAGPRVVYADQRLSDQRVSYTVQAGDTLWSIARRIAPGRDPRPLVDQLIEDNHLEGAPLQPGQVIFLPAPVR